MHLQKFDYSLKPNDQLNVSVQTHDLNKIKQYHNGQKIVPKLNFQLFMQKIQGESDYHFLNY